MGGALNIPLDPSMLAGVVNPDAIKQLLYGQKVPLPALINQGEKGTPTGRGGDPGAAMPGNTSPSTLAPGTEKEAPKPAADAATAGGTPDQAPPAATQPDKPKGPASLDDWMKSPEGQAEQAREAANAPKPDEKPYGFWRRLGIGASGAAMDFGRGPGKGQQFITDALEANKKGTTQVEDYKKTLPEQQNKAYDSYLDRMRKQGEITGQQTSTARTQQEIDETARKAKEPAPLTTPDARRGYANAHPDDFKDWTEKEKSAWVVSGEKPPEKEHAPLGTPDERRSYEKSNPADFKGWTDFEKSSWVVTGKEPMRANPQQQNPAGAKGQLTPAEIAREKIRLDDEYQKKLADVEKLIREGVPDPSGIGKTPLKADDPTVTEMKQRAQDDYERGLEAIGQTPSHVTYRQGEGGGGSAQQPAKGKPWTPPAGLPDLKTGNGGKPIPDGTLAQVNGKTVAIVQAGQWAAPPQP